MKQIIQYQKNGEISIEDLPDIQIAPGGIIVQNHYSLISPGTERTSVSTAQASMIGKARSRPDLVKQVIDNYKREGLKATYEKVMNRLDNYKDLGYSSAGVVIESNVEEFKPGDRVACAGAGYASHAELVFIPKNLAVKIPENVTMEEAAFTTLGSIALQGVRQADVKLGENVAVIGLGLLGLITVQLLKANGCRVIGLDISIRNFDLVKDLGCDEVIPIDDYSIKIIETFTNGYGTDAVIITASTKSNDPVEEAIAFARKKSKIVIVGAVGMNIPRQGFYEKELDLRIACSYGPGRYDVNYELKGIDYPIGYVRWTEKRNMEAILQLLSEGKLNFKKLITHKIPIEAGLKAYDLITGKIDEPYLGILIQYNQEPLKNFVKVKKNNNFKSISKGKIVIGFIGAGNFAQSYLLPFLKEKNVVLKNVATRKPIHAKSVAEKFSFMELSTDPAVIFNDESINTVFIATHHNSHAKYVMQAIKNGKNVFVEKPLAIKESELDQIKEEFKKQNVHLMVGFNRRFSKPFNVIKDFFSKTKGPFIINYRVNAGFIPPDHWIQDVEQGGRIIGEACHFIDIFDFIIDAKPVSLYASSICANNALMKDQDNISVIINYTDGSVANLLYVANGDKALPKEYCEIFAGGLTAVMDDFKKVVLYKNNKAKKLKFNGQKGHKEEIDYFINLIKGKEQTKLIFDKIYTTTLITFKILESLRKNEIVLF